MKGAAASTTAAAASLPTGDCDCGFGKGDQESRDWGCIYLNVEIDHGARMLVVGNGVDDR